MADIAKQEIKLNASKIPAFQIFTPNVYPAEILSGLSAVVSRIH
jgi:hypothetical protein